MTLRGVKRIALLTVLILIAIAALKWLYNGSIAGRWIAATQEDTFDCVLMETAGTVTGSGAVSSNASASRNAPFVVQGQRSGNDIGVVLSVAGQAKYVALLRFRTNNRLEGELYGAGQAPRDVSFAKK